jgi:hypothetical protein
MNDPFVAPFSLPTEQLFPTKIGFRLFLYSVDDKTVVFPFDGGDRVWIVLL